MIMSEKLMNRMIYGVIILFCLPLSYSSSTLI